MLEKKIFVPLIVAASITSPINAEVNCLQENPNIFGISCLKLNSNKLILKKVINSDEGNFDFESETFSLKDYDKCHDKTIIGPVGYSKDRTCPDTK